MLFGDRVLPIPASLALFAMCEELLVRGARRAEVWTFLSDELLAQARCTLDFQTIGDHVPLGRAVELYAVATEELVQVRKSVATVTLLARVVARRHSGDEEEPRKLLLGRMGLWMRHVFMRVVVEEVQRLALVEVPPPRKEGEEIEGGGGGGGGGGSGEHKEAESGTPKSDFDDRFDSFFYTVSGSIPQSGSGRVRSMAHALPVVLPGVWEQCGDDLQRVCLELGVPCVMTDDDFVGLLAVLRATSARALAELRTPVGGILHLMGSFAAFEDVWEGK